MGQPDRASRKPVQVILPHPLFAGQPAEGLYMKMGTMKTLSFQFGWCNMQEQHLVRNAKAVIAKVKSVADFHNVREIRVRDMDGMTLPVWEAVSKRRQKVVPETRDLKVMGPPALPPLKRAKGEPLPG